MKRQAAACVFVMVWSVVALAQQKGNVVEYFGRERIKTVEEGRIIHRFERGLMLNDAIRPGMLLGNQDVILWQLARDAWQRPKAGDTVVARFPQGTARLQWAEVEADSNHLFTGMQRGWLYADYESKEEKIVLLDATGNTLTIVNGLPYEGDHYDYGYTLHPIKLKAGKNEFLFSYGRFQRMKASLIEPENPIILLRRDMTLPSLLFNDPADSWAGIRLINATESDLTGLKLVVSLETGEKALSELQRVPAMSQRKIVFRVPALLTATDKEKIEARLLLTDAAGQLLHSINIQLKVQDARRHHERTFVSRIDGSVQYYSLIPSLNDKAAQPLVLSLHGASVEATNQTRAYKAKDWMHLVAPTNRRPFGFNWEDWGRLDAFEVLDQARRLWKTDTLRTYVTGHSMGGHGTWVMGGTYPGLFAAMAPAAGYPDIIAYRRTGSDTAFFSHPHFKTIYKASLHARMLNFAENLVQTPLYVLHGDADEVVPVQQARHMREMLAPFHPNMEYYEYPGGTHWYGDESMDWPPLFEFLKKNRLKPFAHRDTLQLTTANIGVNATTGWLTIVQQQENGSLSTFKAIRSHSKININTSNVRALRLSDEAFKGQEIRYLVIDGKQLKVNNKMYFVRTKKGWKPIANPSFSEKHPGRNGGFKTAFDHGFLLVYGTGGTAEEREWNRRRALFDAEAFLYRANGAPEVIADTLFRRENFPGRNVILYGNADNNLAWDKLLLHASFKAGKGYVKLGSQRMEGDDLGYYVLYPMPGSENNVVGMVGGTGLAGMRATVQNHYFSGITAFPDVLIFRADWLLKGPEGIDASGFFGYDWGVENGRWER